MDSHNQVFLSSLSNPQYLSNLLASFPAVLPLITVTVHRLANTLFKFSGATSCNGEIHLVIRWHVSNQTILPWIGQLIAWMLQWGLPFCLREAFPGFDLMAGVRAVQGRIARGPNLSTKPKLFQVFKRMRMDLSEKRSGYSDCKSCTRNYDHFLLLPFVLVCPVCSFPLQRCFLSVESRNNGPLRHPKICQFPVGRTTGIDINKFYEGFV